MGRGRPRKGDGEAWGGGDLGREMGRRGRGRPRKGDGEAET